MTAKSYNLVYVGSSEDRWWTHSRMTHSSSKGSMTWDTHRTYILVQSPDFASRCLYVTFWWFYPEHLWSHFLSQSHRHAYTQAAIARIATNTHTHTRTHIYEQTHSLAPPVSVSRLIWCSRLCSKHSWSARVNRSCQTWAGRLRAQGTGGCRRTPLHDSPAGTPAQSHPPGASPPPSWPFPPHWEGHLQEGFTNELIKWQIPSPLSIALKFKDRVDSKTKDVKKWS